MFLLVSFPTAVAIPELLRVSFFTVSILVYTLSGVGLCRDGVVEIGRPSIS